MFSSDDPAEHHLGFTATICSLLWVTGFKTTAATTTGRGDAAIPVESVTIRAVGRYYERGIDDNTDSDARTGHVRSIFTGTDTGAYSSRSTNPFLAFASTSTIFFTTSVRGLERGADIVRESVAYDR